jgi:hypothetical protein
MANELDISVKSWYSRGWNTYKNNPNPLILGTIILTGFSFLVTFFYIFTEDIWVILLFNFLIMPVLTVGWLLLCLKIVRGEYADFTVIFYAFSKYLRVWVTFILFTLIVVGGMFLLIFPGILWALKYGMSLYVVIDRPLFGRSAYRYSKEITKGYRGKLFITLLLASVLSALGYPFSIGLQKIGSDIGTLLLIIGVVPLLANMILITPWLGVTFASAYESLKKN